MGLTSEQLKIVEADHNIMVIDAKAGSGKTTTLLAYVKNRPKQRFLYLVFNRKMKEDAEKKVKKLRLYNIKVETIHSFIMKMLPKKKISDLNIYKIYEATEFKLKTIRGCVKIYDNYLSSKYKTSDEYIKNNLNFIAETLKYRVSLEDIEGRYFLEIKNFIDTLFNKMELGELDATFDFCLKYYQIYGKEINQFDIILIDEAQDTSPIMNALIDDKLRNSRKIYVGDTKQQIYQWRGAINSLESIENATHYSLTNSFRVAPTMANILKQMFRENNENFKINGLNKTSKIVKEIDTNQPFTFLSRTNASLIIFALKFHNKKIYYSDKIKFDMLDAVYTFYSQGDNSKHINLRYYETYEQLCDEYQDGLVFDTELNLSLQLVEEYKEEIPEIIEFMKASKVEYDKADIKLMTAHSSKGLEFDKLIVGDDFIDILETKENIRNLKEEVRSANDKDRCKLIEIIKYLEDGIGEELNVKYVAYTRGKGDIQLNYPITLEKMIKNQERIDNELEEFRRTSFLESSSF